jgi:hypothetical protein
MELKGCPPEQLVERAARKKYFFNEDGTPKLVKNNKEEII